MRFWSSRIFLCFGAGFLVGKILHSYVSRELKKRDVSGLSAPLGTAAVNGAVWSLVMLAGGEGGVLGLECRCLMSSALLAVGVIDWKTREIPGNLTLFIGAQGILKGLLDVLGGQLWDWGQLAGMAAGGGLFLAAYGLTGGKKIGGGDVKLAAAAGLFLGGGKILRALFGGLTAAVLVYLPLTLLKKTDRQVALGPFLALGILAAMLF